MKFFKGVIGLIACSILFSTPVSAAEIPSNTNTNNSYIKEVDLDTYCQAVAEMGGITINEAKVIYYATIAKHEKSLTNNTKPSYSTNSVDLGSPVSDGSGGSTYYTSFIVYNQVEFTPTGWIDLEMTTPCIIYGHPSIGYEFVQVNDNVNVVITNNGRHTVTMSNSAAQKTSITKAAMRARIVLDCSINAGAAAGYKAMGFNISITGHARKTLSLSHTEVLTHR